VQVAGAAGDAAAAAAGAATRSGLATDRGHLQCDFIQRGPQHFAAEISARWWAKATLLTDCMSPRARSIVTAGSRWWTGRVNGRA